MLRDAQAIQCRRHPVALAVVIAAVSLLSAPLSRVPPGRRPPLSPCRRRPGAGLPLCVQRQHRRLHRCRRHGLGHRLARGPQQRHHVSRRDVRRPGRPRWALPGRRLRHLRRPTDHLDRCRRLPAGTDDGVHRRRWRDRLNHRIRRPCRLWRPTIRRGLQPRPCHESHEPHHRGRPRRIRCPRTARQRTRRRPSPSRRGSRLRRRF